MTLKSYSLAPFYTNTRRRLVTTTTISLLMTAHLLAPVLIHHMYA